MARIALMKPENMTELQRRLFDAFPINLTRTLLRTTGSADPYLKLGLSFPHSELGWRNVELVITRIAALSQSAYEKLQHHDRGLATGISEKELAAVEAGDFASLSQSDQVLLRYVDECARDIRVSDQTFGEAASIFSETQIADLTLLIGFYMMTARFIETLEVDLDAAPKSWPKAL
jgi:alkylhydroperoxidase family enzyme